MADRLNVNSKKQLKKQKSPENYKEDELSMDQIDELFEAFTLFDKDYNGCISKKELGVIMESTQLNTVEGELVEMLREADTEGNGFIDFPEFVSVLARKSIRVDDNAIDELFKIFSSCGSNADVDSDVIDAKSLQTVLADLGETTLDQEHEEELENLIAKARLHFNTNQDGKAAISKDDFKEMIKSIDINHTKVNLSRSLVSSSKK